MHKNKNLFDDINNLMRFDFKSYQGGLFWTIVDIFTMVLTLIVFGYLFRQTNDNAIVNILYALLCVFVIVFFSRLILLAFGSLVLTYIHEHNINKTIYELPYNMAIDKIIVIFILLDIVCKLGLFISLYTFLKEGGNHI